jgi:hypothetical protein
VGGKGHLRFGQALPVGHLGRREDVERSLAKKGYASAWATVKASGGLAKSTDASEMVLASRLIGDLFHEEVKLQAALHVQGELVVERKALLALNNFHITVDGIADGVRLGLDGVLDCGNVLALPSHSSASLAIIHWKTS